MRAVLCLAAEGVIRDAETNTISVFNILERITATGFPLFIQRLTFFALWERALEDPERTMGHFRAELGGRDLHTIDLPIDFQGRLLNRTTIRIAGLVVPQPGSLRFSIALEDGTTASYTVEVNAVVDAVQVDERT